MLVLYAISDLPLYIIPADFTPFIVPAATLGAIGYGYMWFKVSYRVPTKVISDPFC